MKKILLADDEEIIRLGISTLIPWEELGVELVYIAESGQQALDYMRSEPVDIVITDIRMPGMDGLALIESCFAQKLCRRFILLTGYSEFEYAQCAMKYGVRHYLIKPTDETEIIRALRELCAEIDVESAHNRLRFQFEKTAPANLFQEILTQPEGTPEFIHRKHLQKFVDMIRYEGSPCSIVLIEVENRAKQENSDSLSYFVIENMCKDIFPQDVVLCSIVLNNKLILLQCGLAEPDAKQILYTIISDFKRYYHQNVSMTLSSFCQITEIRELYQEVQKHHLFHFYMSPGAVLTPADAQRYIILQRHSHKAFHLIYKKLDDFQMTLRHGNDESVSRIIHKILSPSAIEKIDYQDVLELIAALYRMIQNERYSNDTKELVPERDAGKIPLSEILSLKHIEYISDEMVRFACEILAENQKEQFEIEQDPVKKIKIFVTEELSNPDLSLKWIAQNKLFMNENYLSRLFQKKTGYKFSYYLAEHRMKEAKRLLQENPDIKLSELCYKTGFANNPTYLSTLFKNYFGCTITEYRKNERDKFSDGRKF